MHGTDTSTTVRTTQSASPIGERVTTAPLSEARAYLAKPVDQWGWTDLRDFVVFEIERRTGAIPNRDPAKEAGIFKRFLRDWSYVGPMIAQHAFDPDACDGVWRSAPIRLERFTKGNDEFFAIPIAQRIADAQAAQSAASG